MGKNDLQKLEVHLLGKNVDAVYFEAEDDYIDHIIVYDKDECDIFQISGDKEAFLLNSYTNEYQEFYRSPVKLANFIRRNKEGL